MKILTLSTVSYTHLDVYKRQAYGFETNSADEEGLRRWLRGVPKEGVTSILPATVTDQEEMCIRDRCSGYLYPWKRIFLCCRTGGGIEDTGSKLYKRTHLFFC